MLSLLDLNSLFSSTLIILISCILQRSLRNRVISKSRRLEHNSNQVVTAGFQKPTSGESSERALHLDRQRLHNCDTAAGRHRRRQLLLRSTFHKDDPRRRAEDEQEPRRRRVRRPSQPPQPAAIRDARHSHSSQCEDHSQAAGGQGDPGQRHQGPGQEEEEDAGEEGRQEGGENALGDSADFHHNLDAL